MKLNNITKMVCSGALMLLGAISINSCTDKNDWDVDSSYDRLFHTTSLSVTPLADRIAVDYKLMPNTAKYIVEISKDSLYNDIVENANGNSIIEELTTSPDTIYNLEGSTKYYIRMRGVSEDGKSSNWKYLNSYSFKTKSEQIITGIIPSSTTADVSFIAGKEVDKARLIWGNDSVEQNITSENVKAGTVTLTNLIANTSYTLKLMNGENVRGTYKFKTTEAYPEGYEVITLSEDDNLNSLMENAKSDKVVIVFPQGIDYKMPLDADGKNLTPTIPANIKSVYFWGAAGENKPTFHPSGVKIAGTDVDIVRFYNLTLKNNGKSADYIVNVSADVNINALQIDKCDISDTRGVIRYQSLKGECTTKEMTINNCFISNIGSYGVINLKGLTKLSVGTLNITNSTISGVEAGALVNVQQANMAINVDHCTIYNCVQTAKSMFDVNKLTTIKPNISNCLIGPFYNHDDTTIKGCSVKGQQDVTNTFFTSDMNWNSGFEIGDGLTITSKELWVDAENGDFTIQNLYKANYEQYGDPRWIVTE